MTYYIKFMLSHFSLGGRRNL